MNDIRINQPLRLFAPAKVNLGLEVVRRRDDGYHDVVTLLQTVSLFDEIHLTPSNRLAFEGDPRVPSNNDLALRAILLFAERLGIPLKAKVRIDKRIPIGAGLGGGSSDAATILAALCALSGTSLLAATSLAAELGSDVPFFVRGGAALATGTGTTLEALPAPPRTWFLIVLPDVWIPAKTASLYARLRDDDFTDGEATRELALKLRNGQPVDAALMHNSFARALSQVPEFERAKGLMLAEGARFVLPCGAGPGLFTMPDSWDESWELEQRLRGAGLKVVACTYVAADVNACRVRSQSHTDADDGSDGFSRVKHQQD